MRRVLDNIYVFTLNLPFPATPELNVYYLDEGEPVVIDTGLGDQRSMRIFSSELRDISRGLSDVEVIINTHEHIEHFGGNQKIKEASGARVVASYKAAPIIENYHQHILSLKNNLSHLDFEPEMKQMINRYFDFPLLIDESKVERRVGDWDTISLDGFGLRVFETPGHAYGHICLHDEDRKILFSGDHVIGTGTTFVGYGWRELFKMSMTTVLDSEAGEPDNISLYIESLEKLQSLDLELILPAHGSPITESYKKLREDIQRKLSREQAFLRVLEKRREMTLEDLTVEVYDADRTNYLPGSRTRVSEKTY
ncbi:MAG: MBL fold metallo-hydrolase [Candidatus Freyarchaeota archaeon]